MSDDDDLPRNVRDFRLMARTGFWVVVGICTVIGAVIAHFIHEERQDALIGKIEERVAERLKAVEKWQSDKDRAAQRELWRRERGDALAPPKS